MVISSELLEIIGLCHRVIVMRSSRIVASLEGSAINEDEIMLYATGVKSPQSLLFPMKSAEIVETTSPNKEPDHTSGGREMGPRCRSAHRTRFAGHSWIDAESQFPLLEQSKQRPHAQRFYRNHQRWRNFRDCHRANRFVCGSDGRIYRESDDYRHEPVRQRRMVASVGRWCWDATSASSWVCYPDSSMDCSRQREKSTRLLLRWEPWESFVHW